MSQLSLSWHLRMDLADFSVQLSPLSDFSVLFLVKKSWVPQSNFSLVLFVALFKKKARTKKFLLPAFPKSFFSKLGRLYVQIQRLWTFADKLLSVAKTDVNDDVWAKMTFSMALITTICLWIPSRAVFFFKCKFLRYLFTKRSCLGSEYIWENWAIVADAELTRSRVETWDFCCHK